MCCGVRRGRPGFPLAGSLVAGAFGFGFTPRFPMILPARRQKKLVQQVVQPDWVSRKSDHASPGGLPPIGEFGKPPSVEASMALMAWP